jgi:hypothetical protein
MNWRKPKKSAEARREVEEGLDATMEPFSVDEVLGAEIAEGLFAGGPADGFSVGAIRQYSDGRIFRKEDQAGSTVWARQKERGT